MLKYLTLSLSIILFVKCQVDQTTNPHVITSDIELFWDAFDKINTTKDSSLQYKYLDSLYLDKGTIGLNAIREVRNYSRQDYLNAINNYPKFWASIRKNTNNVDHFASKIDEGIEEFKNIYPDMKPAKIYFTIGAFRTNGCLLYTSPSPRDKRQSRMPSSA